jgi:Kdo2-lipid IVA lauroyltransferase/acyltransferase
LNPVVEPNPGAVPASDIESQAPISIAGALVYKLLPARQEIVRANLRRAFGNTLTEAEIQRLAISFYAHFARSLMEFFALPLLRRQTRTSLARVENPALFFQALEQRRGVLLFGGHTGNWEVALAAAILQYPQLRHRVNVFRRPFRPGWLERLVRRRFERAGIGTIEKKWSMRTIMQRLADNQAVGFTMDQHSAPKEGVLVNFFGHPAWTFRNLAVVALRTRAPVLPVAIWRDNDGHHVFCLEEPLPLIVTGDLREDIRANTQAYNDTLERIILRHPEQWIWNHRRWKNVAAVPRHTAADKQ